MGKSKHQSFTEDQNATASAMKALAHPARIAIIELLLEKNACICGEIVDELPLAQATISQHLKELKKGNIIEGTISGKSICYCINPDGILSIKKFISIINNAKNQQNSC